MAAYFAGRKLVKTFTQMSASGRERLDWRVFEEWRDVNEGITARCGNPGSCTVEHTSGLSEKALSTLKDVAGGSFGVKDVWALKLEVEHVIGHEVNWETTRKSSKTFSIQAPKCGRSALTIYQLFRVFEITEFRKKFFTFSDEKWMKRPPRTVDEPTNTYDGVPDTIPYDPACGCPEPPTEPRFDGMVCLDFGRISMRVPYGVTQTGLEIQIDTRIVNVTTSDFPALLRGLDNGLELEVSAAFIPEPLLFVGAITEQFLRGTVRRITDFSDAVDEGITEVTDEPVIRVRLDDLVISEGVSAG